MPGGVQAISRIIALPQRCDANYYLPHLQQRSGRITNPGKTAANAEIYRRYLAGEDSVVLGRAFGLSDRRIRDIIEHERKQRILCDNQQKP